MINTAPNPDAATTRVGMISLGCAKNLMDAEVMPGSLMADGMEITNEPAEADAPDIDGRVYVQGELPVGDFFWVRVIGCTDYDLIAEPV